MEALLLLRNKRISIPALLRFAAGSTVLGWGLIHLFWDPPYRTFLWSESLLSGWVEKNFQMPWGEFVTSDSIEKGMQTVFQGMGVLLILIAFVLWFSRSRKMVVCSVFLSSPILFALNASLFKESGLQIAMLIEYASQVLAPILLVAALYRLESEKMMIYLKVVIFCTFLGHGLYALGYYPVPGHFLDMVINILKVDEVEARAFLKMAGVLDLIVCVGIWNPGVSRSVLSYAAFWGFATTLARPVSMLNVSTEWGSLFYSLVEAIYRVPHFIFPLAAWILLGAVKNAPIRTSENAPEKRIVSTTWQRI